MSDERPAGLIRPIFIFSLIFIGHKIGRMKLFLSDRPLDRELIRKREVDPRKRLRHGIAVFLIRQLHRKDGKIMADHRKTGL